MTLRSSSEAGEAVWALVEHKPAAMITMHNNVFTNDFMPNSSFPLEIVLAMQTARFQITLPQYLPDRCFDSDATLLIAKHLFAICTT